MAAGGEGLKAVSQRIEPKSGGTGRQAGEGERTDAAGEGGGKGAARSKM